MSEPARDVRVQLDFRRALLETVALIAATKTMPAAEPIQTDLDGHPLWPGISIPQSPRAEEYEP